MANAGFDFARLAQTRAAMQRFVDAGHIAGIVMLTWRHGQIAQAADALGLRDIESRAPMTRDTLFRIASMTKPITSVAALMLVEEGRIALESAVTNWLPELAKLTVLCDPEGSLTCTEPVAKPITLLDLLTHRAGFAYHFTATGELAAYESVFNGFDAMVDPARWLDHVAELPLMYQPGQRWHYGIATDVLGALVQRVAGMPLGKFFRTRIFEPLGMRDTGFSVSPEQAARLSTSYAVDANGRRSVEDHPATSRWLNPKRLQSGGRRVGLDRRRLSAGRCGGARKRAAPAIAQVRRPDAFELSHAGTARGSRVRLSDLACAGLRVRRIGHRRSRAATARRLSLDGLVLVAGRARHQLVRRSGGEHDRHHADPAALDGAVSAREGIRAIDLRRHRRLTAQACCVSHSMAMSYPRACVRAISERRSSDEGFASRVRIHR